MYAIAHVLYGVPTPLDFDYHKAKEKEFLEKNPSGQYISVLENAFENEQDGFLSYYSGNADVEPRAFGVFISRFDECGYIVNQV